jgi:hypothetical protein
MARESTGGQMDPGLRGLSTWTRKKAMEHVTFLMEANLK